MRAGGAVYWAGRALSHGQTGASVVAASDARDRELRAALELDAPHVSITWRDVRATTAFSLRYLDGGARREMRVDDAGCAWTVDDVRRGPVADVLSRARWIHVGALLRSDFGADTLAELARSAPLLVDGQGLARVARTGALTLDGAFDRRTLAHVRALKLDEDEAVALAGASDDASLRALGVPEVLVTRGVNGSRVVTSDYAFDVPAAPPVASVDPTGAGDGYCAAYATARAAGADPLEAARAASAFVPRLLRVRSEAPGPYEPQRTGLSSPG